MTKKIILLAAGIILLILGCVIMIHTRKWLATWWGLHGSGWIYFWIICASVALINYLVMLVISSAFESNKLKNAEINQSSDAKGFVINDAEKTYHYSNSTILVFFVIALWISMGGVTFDDPSKPMATAGYIIEFCLSVFFCCGPYTIKFLILKLPQKK